MTKRILIILLLGVSMVKADWLDDLGNLVKQNTLDTAAAQEVLGKHIKLDQDALAVVEKKMTENNESGFWATIRGGTFQAELAAAKSQLAYHQKVAKSLKELPENKKEREKLVSNLIALKKAQEELEQIKKEYAQAKDVTEKIKIGARIAAKEVQIQGLRSFIKGLFLF